MLMASLSKLIRSRGQPQQYLNRHRGLTRSCLTRFDIFLPGDYPASAPKIALRWPAPHPLAINPCLNSRGVACISLLHTHDYGDGSQFWRPGLATGIATALTTIRALVLVSNSYKDVLPTTRPRRPFISEDLPPGETFSQMLPDDFYHSKTPIPQAPHQGIDAILDAFRAVEIDKFIQPQTILFFILGWFNDKGRRKGAWELVLKKYFLCHKEAILRTVREWSDQNPAIRKWNGKLLWDGIPEHISRGIPDVVHPGFGSDTSEDYTLDLLERLEETLTKFAAKSEAPD